MSNREPTDLSAGQNTWQPDPLNGPSTIDVASIVEKLKAAPGAELDGPTAGDASEAAAHGSTVGATFIPFPTPAGEMESRRGDEVIRLFDGGYSYLQPLDDPASMYKLYRLSAFLGPLIEAMLTNVYGCKYRLAPELDLDSPKGMEELEDALMLQTASSSGAAPAATGANNALEELTAQAQSESKKIRRLHRIERAHFKFFLSQAPFELGSWDKLRELSGMDLEVTGNAYWEVIRNMAGRPLRLGWLPAITTRATPQDATLVRVKRNLRRSPIQVIGVDGLRRFRKYVQINRQGVEVWFKEYGDPRVMSRATGKYYDTVKAMEEAEWEDPSNASQRPLPATEVYHLKLPGEGSSVYGRPRWSGAYPALRGSRDLDEENLSLVRDEAIPSLMLLVAGGRVGQGTKERINQVIKDRKSGRKGIMVIDAWQMGKQPAGPTNQVTMQIERLKAEQQTDMLFQKYDERCEEKAHGAFRMPRALLGKDLGQNRATTLAMLRFAENQVFGPARNRFDEAVNSIMIDAGAVHTHYVTMGTPPKDPEMIAQLLKMYTEAGVITPQEGREQAADSIHANLPPMEGIWSRLPKALLTTVLQTKNKDLAAVLLGNDTGALNSLTELLEKAVEEPDGKEAKAVSQVKEEESDDEE